MTAGVIDNVKFTYGSTIVFLACTNVKENYTNGITTITIPTTDETPNTSSLINLNKMEDRFTVRGYLPGGKIDSSETYTSAYDKKQALKTMFGKGEVVTMTWEGNDYTVGVDKYEIDYKPRDDVSMTRDSEAVYDVVVSCIVGIDMV